MNIDEILKKYDKIILIYARKADPDYVDDAAQYIRIYIWKQIKNFDSDKSPLDYFVKMAIKTAYRKIIYDKLKQEKFERELLPLTNDNSDHFCSHAPEDNLYELIDRELDISDKNIFYAVIYDTENLPHKKIAKKLGIPYIEFEERLENIRAVIRRIMA